MHASFGTCISSNTLRTPHALDCARQPSKLDDAGTTWPAHTPLVWRFFRAVISDREPRESLRVTASHCESPLWTTAAIHAALHAASGRNGRLNPPSRACAWTRSRGIEYMENGGVWGAARHFAFRHVVVRRSSLQHRSLEIGADAIPFTHVLLAPHTGLPSSHRSSLASNFFMTPALCSTRPCNLLSHSTSPRSSLLGIAPRPHVWSRSRVGG